MQNIIILWVCLFAHLSNAGWNNGKFTLDIGSADNAGKSVSFSSNGWMYVVGPYMNGDNYDIAIVRYHQDGELDTSFSNDGLVTYQFSANKEIPFGMSLETTTDKPVITGVSRSANDLDILTLRYNTDGSLDTTFDIDGLVTENVNGLDRANATFHNTNNGTEKVVIAGNTNHGEHVLVIRYNTDGSRDTTFHNDGLVTSNPTIFKDNASSASEDNNNKIVLMGSLLDAYAGMMRFNSNGSVDTTFHVDGFNTTYIDYPTYVYDGLVQSTDNKLVGVGYVNQNFGVFRYNSNGTEDTSFDIDGIYTLDINGKDSARAIREQASGKLAVGGFSNKADFAIIRLNSNGQLDTTYDNDGLQTTDVGGSVEDIAFGLAERDESFMVLAGRTANSNYDISLVRHDYLGELSEPGAHDPHFDSDGKVTMDVATNELILGIQQQDDGKIMACGQENGNLLCIRVELDGTLDTTFDIDGVQTFSSHAANGFELDALNRPLGAGGSGGTSKFMRVNTNGTMDTSFSNDGLATVSATALEEVTHNAADGKILGAGTDGTSAMLLRINSNGTVDTSFNNDGIATHAVSGGDEGLSGFIDGDGKFLVSGEGGANVFVVRFTSNGLADTTFNNDGLITLDSGGGTDIGERVKVTAGGKVIVGGRWRTSHILLARFNSDGSVDTTFDVDGVATVASSTQLRDFVMATNEKYIVTGTVSNDMFVARFTSNGDLDTSLDVDGIQTTDYSGVGDARTVNIQDNGMIIVSGNANGSADAAIWRIFP